MCFFNYVFSQNCNCTISIPSSQLFANGNSYNVRPGDTICLMAGNRDYLSLHDFHGDSLNYIVFINCGGSVVIKNNYQPYGILISNCSYFKFTGSGFDSIYYGIKILETKPKINGLNIGNKSSNYEIDHLEICNTGFAGIMAKTDPVCDLSTNYGNFTQCKTSIHDNYIHEIGGEGFYIGHSYYTGFKTTCTGHPDTLYPHAIKGLRIFNNHLKNCHWDGIQVGCATEDCEIHNNTVINYGLDLKNAQNAGIQISAGTTGKCYNNYIANGSGNGINVFGLGNNLIFNNIILNPGRNNLSDPNMKVNGIFCDDRATMPGSSFNFISNTIINPKTDGIRIYSTLSNNNNFFNNIIINPGSLGSYPTNNQSYIYTKSGVNATISNNYFDIDMKNIMFIDSLNNNFKLSEFSPARDAGKDITAFGTNYDFDNYPRPYTKTFDIGAYEYIPENTITEHTGNNEEIKVFPNSNKGVYSFSINNRKIQGNYKIRIINHLGYSLYETEIKIKENQTIDIPNTFKSGIYFIILQSKNNSIKKKLIIH